MTVLFSAPSWLGLLALPLAFLLWRLLRRRGRASTVSSLLLWPESGVLPASPRRFAWSRPDAGLILGVAILVGLALATAAPWWTARPGARSLAVVVDASPSMATPLTGAEGRRIDVARRVATALLGRGAPARHRLLWVHDGHRVVVAGAPGERRAFDEALAAVELGASEETLSDVARSAAARIAALGGGRLVVISDFAGFDFDVRPGRSVSVETITVGDARENAAVTGLTVSPLGDRPGEGLATATLLHTGAASRRFSVEATLDGVPLRRTELDLQPGAPIAWSFAFPRGAQGVEVRITPGGALSEDDSRERSLPPPLIYSTQEAGGPDRTTSVALQAARAVVQARWAGASGRPVDVRILEGGLPEVLPSRWIRFAAAPERPLPVPTTVLDVVDSRARALDRLFPLRFDPFDLQAGAVPDGTVIARLADRPAVVYVEGRGTRGVWSGLPVEASDLSRRGALPLVLAEWTAWILGDGPVAPPQVEPADLVPAPPGSSRTAADVLATLGPAPRSLQGPLMLWVGTLISIEVWRRRRRSAGLPQVRDPPAEPELPPLRLVAGGRR